MTIAKRSLNCILNNNKITTVKVSSVKSAFPPGIYLSKVNNRNTKTKCEICSKLATKKPGRRH